MAPRARAVAPLLFLSGLYALTAAREDLAAFRRREPGRFLDGLLP